MDQTLSPAPSADDLAQQLSAADETHRTILTETLNSAENGHIEESGRTICGQGTDPRGPLGRFPSAVELQTCPRSLTGVWHTHVDPEQLRDPEHSIPDIGNVVYGEADASMVVGTNSGEVLVAAADREEMQSAFEDVLDIEDGGPKAAVKARDDLTGGEVERAHMMLRGRFDGLVWRVSTGYPELEQRIDTALSDVSPGQAWACPMHTHSNHRSNDGDPADGGANGDTNPVQAQGIPNPQVRGPDVGRLRHKSRCSAQMAKQQMDTSGINIQELVLANVIGNLVDTGLNQFVFGGK